MAPGSTSPPFTSIKIQELCEGAPFHHPSSIYRYGFSKEIVECTGVARGRASAVLPSALTVHGSVGHCHAHATQKLMASAVCGVTARPHLPSAVPAAARKLFFRCRAASTMNEASASSPDAEEKKTTTVFVAGSTGRTGKRVVEKLLAKGFGVVAGTTDVSRARGSLPQDPNLQLVRADVTEGVDKLVEAVRGVDAVVCATGFRRSFDPFAPWKVDNFGTVNLVEACRKAGVTRFVLISSILVNGAAMGQLLNPAYIVLNLLGLTLVAKLQAENHIRKSGINYTIVRPGGLTDQPPTGNIVMEPEDTLYSGSISRSQVAEVAVEALLCPESSYKVVEIIAQADAPNRPLKDMYAAIKQN